MNTIKHLDYLTIKDEKTLYIITAALYKAFIDDVFNDKWNMTRSQWIYLVIIHS